jgi:hypothetical protein
VHIAERPLAFIPLALAGEANAPLAAMVGDQPEAPKLLIVPEPRDRDQRFAFAADLAAVILPYLTSYLPAESPAEAAAAVQDRAKDPAQEDAPQLLVPSPAAIAFIRLLGRSTRFRSTEGQYAVPESVPVLGRWLTFFTERAEHPASCLMLAATDALTLHWATGQSPVEDRNLGALLGWIDPPPGLTGADAGQLDPFSTVETDRWTGLTWDPMQSAVAVLLRHNPDVPVHTLPVSWRLPASAAPVIAEAFYPFTGFRAAATPRQRRLEFATAPFGRNAFDRTLETAAASGWALYELPARHTLRTDTDAVTACAAVAARALHRGPVSFSSYPERAVAGVPVPATRIAVGTAHRDQAQAIRAILAASGQDGITVDTANRLQGREFDLVIVLHPLSGRRDATAFHLESGRLCVLTTRHRHACIVIARAGIPELLDAHPSTDPVHLNVPVKFPDGWEANQSLMAHLQHHKVRAP